MMNKKLTRVFLAGILALSVATAVLLPAMTSVHAATEPATPVPTNPTTDKDQTPAPQPTNPEPPKDSENPHSGHH